MQESMHEELEQDSSSESQQIQSSCLEWMIAEDAEESTIMQSFLSMLDNEHGDTVVQDLYLSRLLPRAASLL